MKNIIILDGSCPQLMCIQLIFDVQANTIMRIAIMYYFEHKRSISISGLEKTRFTQGS